jgi:uncharacterized protein (TIGR02246 family)
MTLIQDLHQKWAAALNSGDAEGIVALYTPDAVLIPSPGVVARGHAEIRAAVQGLLSMKPTMQMETVGVFEGGDGLILAHGKWTLQGTAPDGSAVQMAGVTAEVYQRQADGRWLLHIDNPFAA